MCSRSILGLFVCTLLACGGNAAPPTAAPVPQKVAEPNAESESYYAGTMTVSSPDGLKAYGPPKTALVRRTLNPAKGTIVEAVMQDKLIVATWTLKPGSKTVFDVTDADHTFSGTVTVVGDPWQYSAWDYAINMADGSGAITGRGNWDAAGIHTRKNFVGKSNVLIVDELHPATSEERNKLNAALAAPVTKESKSDAVADKPKPAKDPLKWEGFPGPQQAPEAKGTTLWIVSPLQGGEWPGGNVFLADVVRREPTFVAVKGVHVKEVQVPGAFTRAQTDAKCKKGLPVMVAPSEGLVVGASFGRIKADGTKENCLIDYEFVSISEADVGSGQWFPLEDKLVMGQPVAFVDGTSNGAPAWHSGTYAAAGSEKGKSWVIVWGGQMQQYAKVKPMTVTKMFKKGDKVWASEFATLKPAVILEVLSGGVQYKVKFEGKADETTVRFSEVTSPL
jgi:hypothetical protein